MPKRVLLVFLVCMLCGVTSAQASETQYKESCGQCHMLYPPQLLPAGSWEKIIAGSADHFGENLGLTAEQKKALTDYTRANAAETSTHKRSRKIMDSLGGGTPVRFKDIPYIVRKHRKIGADVFARKAVGGLQNCKACHPGAEQVNFKDDYVSIPQ